RDHPALAARGATDTPRAPVRSIPRATKPDAFASSTTPRTNASPPTRPPAPDHARGEREPRVAPPRRPDGLRHSHEAAVEHARSGQPLHQTQQRLSEPGQRVRPPRLQALAG